jgi:hypothetical protein
MSSILRILSVGLLAGAPLAFAGCEVKVDDDPDIVEPVAVPDGGGKLDVDVDVDRK